MCGPFPFHPNFEELISVRRMCVCFCGGRESSFPYTLLQCRTLTLYFGSSHTHTQVAVKPVHRIVHDVTTVSRLTNGKMEFKPTIKMEVESNLILPWLRKRELFLKENRYTRTEHNCFGLERVPNNGEKVM